MRNKIFYFILFLCFFVVLFEGVFGSVVIEGPHNITVSPTSVYYLKTSFVNQDGTQEQVNLTLNTELYVEPKNTSFFVSGWEKKDVSFKINTPNSIGYYSLEMELVGGNYSKIFIVRVSQIPSQLKNLISYYEERLAVLKSSFKEQEDFHVLLFEAERSLDDAKELFEKELYIKSFDKLDLVRTALNKIEGSVTNSSSEIERKEELNVGGKGYAQFDIHSIIVSLKYLSYILGFIVLLSVLYFLFGRNKFILKKRKLSTGNLKDVKESVVKTQSGKKEEVEKKLKKEIEKVEGTIKKLSESRGLRDLEMELELIKKKYENGFYKMGLEYLRDLKRKLGKNK